MVKYLQKFEANLSDEEIRSVHYQRRLLFVPLLANRKAQADEMIEFLPYDSEITKVINEKYQQIFIKEVERNKHLPSAIVKKMNEEGYPASQCTAISICGRNWMPRILERGMVSK